MSISAHEPKSVCDNTKTERTKNSLKNQNCEIKQNKIPNRRVSVNASATTIHEM